VSEPVRSSEGYHVLQVTEREPPRVPPLEEIEPEVRAEVRRQSGDRALRGYLDDLRRQGKIQVRDTMP
jgi:parvulin-like peptidyl-prolyl isomerase